MLWALMAFPLSLPSKKEMNTDCDMKTVLISTVYMCGWMMVSLTTAFAQNSSLDIIGRGRVDRAIAYLKDTKPMFDPSVEMHLVDPRQRKAADYLFKHQMQAIDALEGCEDASIIPVLIPYLNYTRHPDTGKLAGDEKPEDTGGIKAEWPAFDVITAVPDASKTLTEYILNKKYSLEYRMTAFHVLRYVDKAKLYEVARLLQSEVSATDNQTKQFISFVKDRNIPFDGLYVDMH